VLRKRIRNGLFGLPKSSFGRGKVEFDMHIIIEAGLACRSGQVYLGWHARSFNTVDPLKSAIMP